MTSSASSGYSAQSTGRVPIFNGLEDEYKIWLYRFKCFEKSTRYAEYEVIEYIDGLAKGGMIFFQSQKIMIKETRKFSFH